MLLYNLIYDLISDLIYNKPNVTEIIPGLWLGNHQSAIDIDFLKKDLKLNKELEKLNNERIQKYI